jgi:hypothetical protein
VRVTVVFDEYEASLLKKVRQELKAIANRNGKKPPNLKDIVRGAVRMGVHAVYGEDFVTNDIVSRANYLALTKKPRIDLSQNTEEQEDEDEE